MNNSVSILMPTHNAFPYLVEAVDGIINQSFTNWHLHIIDDASTDESKGYLLSIHHPSIQVTFLKERVGPEEIINTYLPEIESEYFALTDADDVWHPDKLQLQVKALQKSAEAMFCGTSYLTINEKGIVTKSETLNGNWQSIKKNAQHHPQFLAGTILYQNQVKEFANPFFAKNNLDGYGDMQLIYGLLNQYPCFNLQQPLYAYRILPTSRSRQNITSKKLNIYTLIVRNQIKTNPSDFQDAPDKTYFQTAFYHLYWKLPHLALKAAKQGLQTKFSLLNFFRFLYILFNIGLLKTKQSFNKTHYSTLFAHS
jgi:glycosyltransferase involved in cell wall biosynthesis